MNFGFYIVFLVIFGVPAIWAAVMLLRRRPRNDFPENSRADQTEPPELRGEHQHRHHHPA